MGPLSPKRSSTAATAPEPLTAEQVETQIAGVIANQIRTRRQQLGYSVDKLAERSEMSKSMLSKIENASVSPSLATLSRLAVALDMPFTSFFRGLSEEREAVLVKAGHGPTITRQGSRAGHHYQLLGSPRPPFNRIQPLLVSLTERTEVFPVFQHPGIEMLHMLTGVVEYGHGTGRYRLEPGDTLLFEGEISHGPTQLIKLPIRFLTITLTSADGP
jgi:DNA-binding XRE family transcriptional regulator